MARIVSCGVCGKGFAVTEEDYNRIQQVAELFNNNETTTKFICKFCKKMIKKDDN